MRHRAIGERVSIWKAKENHLLFANTYSSCIYQECARWQIDRGETRSAVGNGRVIFQNDDVDLGWSAYAGTAGYLHHPNL
jgi:hypothetical protein